MSVLFLAPLFAIIAAAYYVTTGDAVGTFGVAFWYIYYVVGIEANNMAAKFIENFDA